MVTKQLQLTGFDWIDIFFNWNNKLNFTALVISSQSVGLE